MSLHVVAYDVTDDARRVRLAKLLLRYGRRVQASVFEVWLDPDDFPALRRGVGALLGPADKFDVFPMDTRPSRTRLRWRRAPEPWDAVVVM